MTPQERQEALEAEMVDRGVARFRQLWAADAERGDLSRQKAIQELMEYQIEPVAKAIDEVREKALTGRAMRKRNVAILAMCQLESEVLAFLAVKEVLNGLMIKAAYGTTQRLLGAAVNAEIMVAKLAAHDESAIEWVKRECKRRKINSKHHQERYYRKMAQHRGSKHRDWTNAERIQVGAALCELVIRTTKIAEVVYVRTGKKTKAVLKANPSLDTWVNARNDQLMLLHPEMLPMVCRPKYWQPSCVEGGYLTYPTVLVKDADKRQGHLKALQEADTFAMRKALHLLDKTPYKVNEEVLEVMQKMVALGRAIPGLEKATELDLPEKPHDIETNEEARKVYAKAARAVHDHNVAAVSTRLQFERSVEIAERFVKEPVLYFPNQLDFRGRAYPMPNTLNPQGPDFARALLEFANERPVQGEACFWLKVNLANLFGEDKLTLEGRALWADRHIRHVLDVAHNPLENRWWECADKPWQFLAACLDWKWVEETGVSQIRVSMDGSCNGIQHFAAMLLDPVAARAVNLADTDSPRDIYQDVAEVVVSHLKLERDPQKKFWADTFIHLGIDRKITKRAVMVMPYGGTLNSTMKYVEQECRERGYHNSFGDDWFTAANYLAGLVFKSTREVVKSGAEVMSWLQEVAKIATRNKVHLRWTTPVGMVAQQRYVKYKTHEIKTYLNGESVRRTVDYVETPRIDPLKSRNGISPNVVHSFDAAAMMMAVNKAAERGVSSFQCIHDDFGTHAADTQVLFETLREAFVEIYSTDQLKRLHREFCAQIPDFIPEPPERGTFDLQEVLRSKYFFS